VIFKRGFKVAVKRLGSEGEHRGMAAGEEKKKVAEFLSQFSIKKGTFFPPCSLNTI
jgi:hypothetical protein